MHGGLGLLFFALLAIVAWAAYVVVIACFMGRTVRGIYLLLVVATVVLAYRMTFHFAYSLDSNTRVHGFPIPVVIFQRIDSNSDWADFVGPTLIFGFPMNLIAYLFPLSLVFLVIAGLRRLWLDPQGDKALIHNTAGSTS